MSNQVKNLEENENTNKEPLMNNNNSLEQEQEKEEKLEEKSLKLTKSIDTPQTLNSTLHDIDSKAPKINYIDDFIDKAGYTKYHFHMFFINAIVFFMIGSEFVITNLLLSTLKKEWDLSNDQVISLSSAIFIGILVTSILSGNINSNYGRKIPTIVGCFILCIFSASTAFISNFWILLLVKICVGIGIGIIIPSYTSLVTECIPNTNRSLVLNAVWGLYPLGMIYVCYIGIHFIKRNIFDWRTTCLINSFTGIPIIYFVLFLDESPRYLFLKVTSHTGDISSENDISEISENNELIKRGFFILNKLGKSANKTLTNQDKKNILWQLRQEKSRNNSMYEKSLQITVEKRKSMDIEESGMNKSIKNKGSNKFSFALFFNEENKFISIYLIFLGFLISLISFGLLVVLPKHY